MLVHELMTQLLPGAVRPQLMHDCIDGLVGSRSGWHLVVGDLKFIIKKDTV